MRAASMIAVLLLGLGLACGGLAGGTTLPGAGPDPGAAAALASPWLELREHRVTDPGMGDQLAATLLVPEGWSVEGGITRPPPAAYRNPVLADLSVEAPDGRGVRLFPDFSFEYAPAEQRPPMSATPNGNFWLARPPSAGAWLREMQQRFPAPDVTDVRVVSEEVDEALTARLREQLSPMTSQIAESNRMGAGLGVRQDFDARVVRVVMTYVEQGRAIEETLLLAWQGASVLQGGRLRRAWWGVNGMRSLRGPTGTDYLDDPALHAILSSVRVDPRWQQEMNRYWMELSRRAHEGHMERRRSAAAAHQQRMNTLQGISERSHSSFRARQAASDRLQEASVDAIHERTTFATPSGETVALPSFYRNVYADGRGHYLLHDNALHDPNLDPTLNDRSWQRLSRAP